MDFNIKYTYSAQSHSNWPIASFYTMRRCQYILFGNNCASAFKFIFDFIQIQVNQSSLEKN